MTNSNRCNDCNSILERGNDHFTHCPKCQPQFFPDKIKPTKTARPIWAGDGVIDLDSEIKEYPFDAE